MSTSLGNYLRERRIALGFSLRQFAEQIGMQPSNYCNIEGDVSPPPAEGVERIATALRLERSTTDSRTFFDLAAKARQEIPADITKIIKENELIPAMLRTLEDENVSKTQLKGIIEDLKSGRFKRSPSKD